MSEITHCGEALQTDKKAILKAYLGNFDEYIFTGWMFGNGFIDMSKREAWKCRWTRSIYALETFKIGDMPTPLSRCHCTTPILWNCLIRHVRTGRLEFVGSTCMKYFDDKRRCTKCLVVNRCKTIRCDKCRVLCKYHNCFHDDNAVHRASDFHLSGLIFGKYEGRTPESLVGVDDGYIHLLFGSSKLTEKEGRTLAQLLPQTKLGFGKYRSKTIDWVRTSAPGYYSWMKKNVDRAFVRYL